jgi:hypothetical protein
MLATLKSLGITPDVLIYHRYPEAPGAESDSGLLLSSGTWATDAANLRQQLNDYLGAAAPSVELDCTENNSGLFEPGQAEHQSGQWIVPRGQRVCGDEHGI